MGTVLLRNGRYRSGISTAFADPQVRNSPMDQRSPKEYRILKFVVGSSDWIPFFWQRLALDSVYELSNFANDCGAPYRPYATALKKLIKMKLW